MGTKNNPSAYDCYANAEPDEPMFVLLARDLKAPALVRAWAEQYRIQNDGYHNEEGYQEALACADAMEKWRRENRPPADPSRRPLQSHAEQFGGGKI